MDDFKKERDEALEEALAIGLTHRKNGRLKEAAAVYSQVLGLDPNNLEALEAMGEIASASDTPHAALPIYAKILHLDPENISALNNRGIHLMSMGDAEASEFSFRKLLKIAPTDIDGLNNLGTNLLQQKRYDEAVEPLNKAIQLAPDSPQAYYNRGVVIMQATPDDYKGALKFFDEAIKIEPNYTNAHVNTASIYTKNGSPRRAIWHLDRALLVNPGDPVILFNKGLNLRALKRYSEAVDCFKTARSSFPEPHVVDYELGETNYQSGDLKTATAFFLMSVSERMSFSQGFIGLGKTLAESGQIAKAKEAFERAGSEDEAHQRLRMLDLVTRDKDPWPFLKGTFEEIFSTGSSSFIKWDGSRISERLYIHTAGIPEGEIILLSRLIPLLSDMCSQLQILMKNSMFTLMQQIDGVTIISDEKDFSPDAISDRLMTSHLYAAPALLGLQSGILPSPGRYLNPNTEIERGWDDDLFAGNELKIGLSWSATGFLTGPQQELKLEEFEPIMSLQGAKFIGISPTDTTTQKNHLTDLNVENLGDIITDFEDLAAAIDKLDILITADNISAHIAGALNKPLIVMLPLLPNWIWGYKSSTTSYYPNATLMRQAIENNWDRPIQTTVRLLSEKYGLN